MASSMLSELEPLAKLLEKDEPKVLVVVGSGVSSGATSASHASWLGLLKHGIEHLVETKVFTAPWGKELVAALEKAFTPFDLQKALGLAELIEVTLREPNDAAFARWLEVAFHESKFPVKDEAVLNALHEMQQAGALLLTTNYDSLLSGDADFLPVTWEQHEEFLKTMTRQRPGVLHIHGHWQQPSSVVLGKSCYERIVKDARFQDALKSLWLQWSWVYVGCGDGLDDPNLGRLLRWGSEWGTASLPHYFLAKADRALAIRTRTDKPPNLYAIGYADHKELAGILHSITPAARCWPFTRVNGDFYLFRSLDSAERVPFPSLSEYLAGEVPGLASDDEITSRLKQYGWAFVFDVASVGKTTLALRMATRPAQREHPAFYVDLGDDATRDVGWELIAAMRRLSRPHYFLILDNVHHQPELARQIWEHWRQRPQESKLLLIATRMQRSVMTSPAQDLAFFEHHVANPAVALRTAPGDLWAIVQHLYRRVAGANAIPLAMPPQSALQAWHHDYGNTLGAFCLAALGHLAQFRRGQWELPLRAASDWVREKWLNKLDPQNLDNALCLAAFGAQELELGVRDESLPHPGRIEQSMRLGLVARTERGQLGQYRQFSLREPSWGRLIIAAADEDIDEEGILFAAAARHPSMAMALSSRFQRGGFAERLRRLWVYLARAPQSLLKSVHDIPLSHHANLVLAANSGRQPELAKQFWEAIEKEPDKLADLAWETPLGDLASFLDAAKRHGRDTAPLWEALEKDPKKLADLAWETPLGDLASFLDAAKRHGRDTVPLWEALENVNGGKISCHWGGVKPGQLGAIADMQRGPIGPLCMSAAK